MESQKELNVGFRSKYVYVLSLFDEPIIDKQSLIMRIMKSHDEISITGDIKVLTADVVGDTTFTFRQKVSHLINLWNAMNDANNYFKTNIK